MLLKEAMAPNKSQVALLLCHHTFPDSSGQGYQAQSSGTVLLSCTTSARPKYPFNFNRRPSTHTINTYRLYSFCSSGYFLEFFSLSHNEE